MNDPDAQMESVAKILAVSILIDNELRDVEMVEFLNAVGHINRKIRPDVILSDIKIQRWFDNNKAELTSILASDLDNSFKVNLLSQITDTALRRTLLASIFSVSICDYELHHQECEYLRLATDLWQASPLNSADLDLIVS